MSIALNRRGFLASTAGFIALHPFSANAATNQAHLRMEAVRKPLAVLLNGPARNDEPVIPADTAGRR